MDKDHRLSGVCSVVQNHTTVLMVHFTLAPFMKKVKKQVCCNLGPQGAIWIMLFSCFDPRHTDMGLSVCHRLCEGQR